MLDFEHQLQQIELDKQEVQRRQTELDVADQFLAEVTEKYQRLTQQLQDKKYEILSAARKEAQQILADANRTVEQTIAAIKEAREKGSGVIAVNGKMVDRPVVLRAERVIALAVASGILNEEELS